LLVWRRVFDRVRGGAQEVSRVDANMVEGALRAFPPLYLVSIGG
jgi:hypothetical protein